MGGLQILILRGKRITNPLERLINPLERREAGRVRRSSFLLGRSDGRQTLDADFAAGGVVVPYVG